MVIKSVTHLNSPAVTQMLQICPVDRRPFSAICTQDPFLGYVEVEPRSPLSRSLSVFYYYFCCPFKHLKYSPLAACRDLTDACCVYRFL